VHPKSPDITPESNAKISTSRSTLAAFLAWLEIGNSVSRDPMQEWECLPLPGILLAAKSLHAVTTITSLRLAHHFLPGGTAVGFNCASAR